MKSPDPLITCSCEITLKSETKTIISPLPRCLWPQRDIFTTTMPMATELGWMVTPTHNLTFVRSDDKQKPLYLHYHNACDYKAWQDGDLP